MTARLLVDLAALTANYRRLGTGHQSIGAVVKANAYGCGAVPVSRALFEAGCRDFFVANCAEALTLRSALPEATLYVFEGPLPDTAAALAAANIIPVVNHAEQLVSWQAHRQLPIALQVDTGMARLGFEPNDLQPEQFGDFELALLLTHLACADEPIAPSNAEQLQRFAQVQARFPDVAVSVGNSAATLAASLPTLGLARPGIALYGGQPFAATHAMPDAGGALQAVAALQGQILQIRNVPENQPVGYGGTWHSARASRIAVVGLGYADGLRRSLSNRGYAVLAGERVPIVGRVSMDLVHLDVTEVEVEVGAWAEFFGAQLPIAELSALLDTIDYELLVNVSSRVRREYLQG